MRCWCSLAALAVLAYSATASLAQTNPCSPKLAEPLKVKTASLIDAVVRADTQSVLKSLSNSGLMIGDNAPTPVADVRRQFSKRTGLYCLFFDSACMAEPSNNASWSSDNVLKKLPVSFREWLKGAGTPKLEVDFLDAPVTKYCIASVFVFPERSAVPANIEFAFVYTHGSWSLAQIGEIAP